jgi:hypothetical protein
MNEDKNYPIKLAPGYQVGDVFKTTLEEAQFQALLNMFPNHQEGIHPDLAEKDIIEFIVSHADEVVDILQPPKELRSRAPRRDKGQKRGPRGPRKPKPGQMTHAQANADLKELNA